MIPRIHLLLFSFFVLASRPVHAGNLFPVFTQSSIRISGFETIGFSLPDGLPSADFWDNASLHAARAFAAHPDNVTTGSGGWMRLVTDGSTRGETWQDLSGETLDGNRYTLTATAYNTPNAQANLANYEVAMKLFEVGRG